MLKLDFEKQKVLKGNDTFKFDLVKFIKWRLNIIKTAAPYVELSKQKKRKNQELVEASKKVKLMYGQMSII